jgi:plasmid stabilization system protein ParE
VSRKLIQRPQAEADAYAQVRYLAQHSPEAAARFAADLRLTFERLTRFTQLGRAWPTREPELKGLRRVRLLNFPLSIFYRPTPEAIEIVRVLHHSRDLPPELQES